MKFLNAAELSKLIYEDYNGREFIGYKFKINNSPIIRVSKESGEVSKDCRSNHT